MLDLNARTLGVLKEKVDNVEFSNFRFVLVDGATTGNSYNVCYICAWILYGKCCFTSKYLANQS